MAVVPGLAQGIQVSSDRNDEAANKFLVVHALGFTFYNIVNICNWVIGGLCKRFPKLPVIWMESGLSRLPSRVAPAAW